jgi:hypothetical protein
MKIPPRILENRSHYLFDTFPSVNDTPHPSETHWLGWVWKEWEINFKYLIERSDAHVKD